MKLRFFFLLLVCLFFYLPLSPQGDTKGILGRISAFKHQKVKVKVGDKTLAFHRSFALLIGVWDYDHWQKFDKSTFEKEMNSMQQCLKDQGFAVIPLINPTAKQFRDMLIWFKGNYGFDETNRFVFFFSGHGYSRDNYSKGYIIPKDAPRPEQDLKLFLKKAIHMEEIKSFAKIIEVRHALFLFDSCFSGAIFQGRDEVTPFYISEALANPVRQMITAGNKYQRVPAKSVFIPTVVNGIREGKADLYPDGYITGTELYTYIKKKIMAYDSGQHPQYGTIIPPNCEAEGDFVFKNTKWRKKPSLPLPVPVIEEEGLVAWAEWQRKFEQTVDKIKKVDLHSHVRPADKIRKWKEVLDVYSQDNPHSEDDEELKAYITKRILHWSAFLPDTSPPQIPGDENPWIKGNNILKKRLNSSYSSYKRLKTFQAKATVTFFPGDGAKKIKATAQTLYRSPDTFHIQLGIGNFRSTVTFKGQKGTKNVAGSRTSIDWKEFKSKHFDRYLFIFLSRFGSKYDIRYVQDERIRGKNYYVVDIFEKSEHQIKLFINRRSGWVEGHERVMQFNGISGIGRTLYDSIKKVDGIPVPFKTVTFFKEKKIMESVIQSLADVKVNQALYFN